MHDLHSLNTIVMISSDGGFPYGSYHKTPAGQADMMKPLLLISKNIVNEDYIIIGSILSIKKEGTLMTDEVERAKMPFRERMRTLFNQDRLIIPGNDVGTLRIYKTFDRLR